MGILPDRTAVIRLVGAVLAEQIDEGTDHSRYCVIDTIVPRRRRPGPVTPSTKGLPMIDTLSLGVG